MSNKNYDGGYILNIDDRGVATFTRSKKSTPIKKNKNKIKMQKKSKKINRRK